MDLNIYFEVVGGAEGLPFARVGFCDLEALFDDGLEGGFHGGLLIWI